MKAAVPQYMGDTQQAAPGHRFGLYFPMWDQNTWEVFEFPKREQKSAKSEAIKKVLAFQLDDKDRMHALAQRQQMQAMGNAVYSEYAVATAPFATGMGYEHPLENGFAFLNPYGLPYLPGSSVKGVMRRAAEELGINAITVNGLFGSSAAEGSQGSQGALNFWDVFPQGDLAIEIMTPHHSEYLQNGGTPHDSESPNPIPFLAVAPGAQLFFHVQCIRNVDYDWQSIVKRCFEHAFAWLGFGAKTAVGYGAMVVDIRAAKDAEKAVAKAADEMRKAAMTPLDRDLEIWNEMDANQRENQVSAWVERMQDAGPDDALRIAMELHTYLQETGHWVVKKKGARKERVRKVKEVLQQNNCL